MSNCFRSGMSSVLDSLLILITNTVELLVLESNDNYLPENTYDTSCHGLCYFDYILYFY